MLERFSVFSTDLHGRLETRPTIDYLKKVLSAYDKKIDSIEASIREQMTRLDSEQEAQNNEIKKLDKELT